MPYPYGMQNAPAVGNGLGGLPRRPPGTRGRVVDFYHNETVARTVKFVVPMGFSKMRVSLIGHGGAALNNPGSGAGCAVSFIKSAIAGSEVICNFAAVSKVAGNRPSSTVSFADQSLTVSDGAAGNPTAGTASGGELNFSGGSAIFGSSYPGAGASPDGPGGDSTSSSAGIAAGGPGSLGTPALHAYSAPTPGGGGSRVIDSGDTSPNLAPGGPALLRIELW